MTAVGRRVGEVLRLERISVDPDPSIEYTSIGVRGFGKGIFHYVPKPGDQLGSLRFFELRPDRLVISNIKGWEGAIAVSTKADSGCIASNRFLTYVAIDGQIDVRWARWYFLSECGIEKIQRASPGSADRNRTLAIDRFEALEIPLPPIDEQRRVAAELDRAAGVAERASKLTVKAMKLASALAASLATRPDIDDVAKAAAGWSHVPLSEVLDSSGVTLSVEPTGRYRIAGIYSFGRGLIDRGWITGADTSYSTLTMVRAGDIVVSKLNGWEGAIAVVSKEFDGYFVSAEYPVFAPKKGMLTSAYFAGVALSPAFWDQLDSSARGSMVRRRRINSTEFLATHIWLAPMVSQLNVGDALQTVDRVVNLRWAASRRIEVLVPAALNAAFAALDL